MCRICVGRRPTLTAPGSRTSSRSATCWPPAPPPPPATAARPAPPTPGWPTARNKHTPIDTVKTSNIPNTLCAVLCHLCSTRFEESTTTMGPETTITTTWVPTTTTAVPSTTTVQTTTHTTSRTPLHPSTTTTMTTTTTMGPSTRPPCNTNPGRLCDTRESNLIEHIEHISQPGDCQVDSSHCTMLNDGRRTYITSDSK